MQKSILKIPVTVMGNPGPPSRQPVTVTRWQQLRGELALLQLRQCEELLNAARVPEFVEIQDGSGCPGNSVAHRLKWFLLRRKDVSVTEAKLGGESLVEMLSRVALPKP